MSRVLSVVIDVPAGGEAAAVASAGWAEQAFNTSAKVVVVGRGLARGSVLPTGANVEVVRLGLSDGCDPDGRIAGALEGRVALRLHAGLAPLAGALRPAVDRLLADDALAALTGLGLGMPAALAHLGEPPVPGRLRGAGVLLNVGAVRRVGGFSRLLRGELADTDLSLRFWRSGLRVEHDDALGLRVVSAAAVVGPAAVRLRDRLHDELIVIERFLPRPMRTAYRHDALRAALAERRFTDGPRADLRPLRGAVHEARRWAAWERKRGRATLPAATLEQLYRWGAWKRRVAEWSAMHRLRRVTLVDRGADLYAAYRAATRAGLRILAVADESPWGRSGAALYRGIPVLPDRTAVPGRADALIVTEARPCVARERAESLGRRFAGPVLTLHDVEAQPAALAA